MTKLEIAKRFIEEHQKTTGTTLSKKKYGEILHHRHPDLFSSPERARTAVRTLTGSHGIKERQKTKTRLEWAGLSLPQPEQNDYSKVRVSDRRVAILSDIHFPYYDKKALDLAIGHIKKNGVDAIILNGDIIDCYQISNFDRDPRKKNLKYEIDMLRSFIQQLRDRFKKARIVYKLGNHEDRYEKFILQRVPELIDAGVMEFETLISARELGVEVVKNKRLIQCGSLNVAHGHEFAKGIAAPVNPARGFYLKAKTNVIAGHHHQTSEHTESDINEKITGAWSTGCLCELHPSYMPINKWNHGFAMVEQEKNNFHVSNLKIINGKVL